MTRRPPARLMAAVAVWAVAWAFAAASLLLAWRAGLPAEPLPGVFLSPAPVDMQSRFDDIGVAVALVFGPVSAVILARRPHPVGVILAVHAVGSGLAAFGVQYGLLGARLPGLPAWGFFAFAAGWAFVPGTFMSAALPLLVTRGRIPGWHRLVVATCAAVATAAFTLSLTQQSVPEPRNPFAIDVPAYQAIVPTAYTALSFVALAISCLSCGVLVARWVRAAPSARAGTAWLTLGHLFLTLSYLALVLPDGVQLPVWAVGFAAVAPVLGQVLYPAAVLVVVLGQRLWGVELVVSRIALWALLTISGVLLYLTVVAVVPSILTGGFDGALWLLTPVAIALAAQPLRGWLQGRIDALVYGEGADPVVLLARIGDRIGELESGTAGLRQLCEALRRALRLGSVEIRSTDAPELAAADGDATGAEVVLALRAGGRRLGDLVVRPRNGQRFDRRTLRLLEDITGLVAAAVQLVESNLALERARRELVGRRAEERRALRRELHDGLGPSLAGICFGLAAVENLLGQAAARGHVAGPGTPRDAHADRDRAEGMLAKLESDLNRRVRDVRELADAVTPSPLEGARLGESIAELAARFGAPGRSIRTRIDATLPAPREVEDALYLIAAEALTNAVRHADAGRIELEVVVGADGATLRVTDDGSGIEESTPQGVGLRSMRERASALGGTLEVASSPLGTRVAADLPFRSLVAIGDSEP